MVLDLGVVLLLNRAGNQKKVVKEKVNDGLDKSAASINTSSNGEGGGGDDPVNSNRSKVNASSECNHHAKKKD